MTDTSGASAFGRDLVRITEPLRRFCSVIACSPVRSLVSNPKRCPMSRLNFRAWMDRKLTHEGAPAALHLTIEQQLRRSVLSCLLWEKEFYEDGVSIADRIVALAEQASPAMVAALAVEARSKFNLRHVPLRCWPRPVRAPVWSLTRSSARSVAP